MKKKLFGRLGVVALALTFVSMTLMGGTLARYVTEVTGNANAEVAAWSFKANASDTKFTNIDLGSTTNRTKYDAKDIKDGVIAPGTKGTFDIVLDGSNSDVGVDYTVKIAAKSGTTLPTDLTFKVINGTGEATDYTLNSDITGTIGYDAIAANMKKTITVSWEWAFDENDTTSSNDNTYADKTWTLDITASGSQTTPVVSSQPN